MEKIWVRVLQTLRQDHQYALFGLVSSLNDVEFTATQIVITTHNDAEWQMLNKHLTYLQQIAGNDCLVLKQPTVATTTVNFDEIQKLQELFGDKIEIL